MTTALAPELSSVAPAHDKDMAAEFLATLDSNATKFTFQFLADGGGGMA